MSDLESRMAPEAQHLHRCIFGRPLDPILERRYEAANRHVFGCDLDSALVACIVERGLDAEAIEFALRRRKAGRELTTKLQILCYLAEARSEYQAEFINDGTSWFRAIAMCVAATTNAFWKLVKGEYLIRRHDLL
jgi:hypothetical protein